MNAKRHVLVNCLRVAADIFGSHATEFEKIPGHQRLADQFKQQADEARKLADDIEEAASIMLED